MFAILFCLSMHQQPPPADGPDLALVSRRLDALEVRLAALEGERTNQQATRTERPARPTPRKRRYVLMHSAPGCGACVKWWRSIGSKLPALAGYNAEYTYDTFAHGPDGYAKTGDDSAAVPRAVPWFEIWHADGRYSRYDSHDLTVRVLQGLAAGAGAAVGAGR